MALLCHSACNIDPPYCLICKCYPDGAVAAVAAPGGFPSLLGGRGCGRVGPYVARAVHSPGQWGRGRGVAERLLGDQLRGRLPPKRPEQTLHDRMLLRPELLGPFLAQPADKCERRL